MGWSVGDPGSLLLQTQETTDNTDDTGLRSFHLNRAPKKGQPPGTVDEEGRLWASRQMDGKVSSSGRELRSLMSMRQAAGMETATQNGDHARDPASLRSGI